ncbi:MAG: FAD-dependent monooxygenase, partial [Paracoccaceae bacterium]
ADFEGTEAGHDLFGWNVANQAIRTRLLEILTDNPTVRLHQGVSVTGYTPRLEHAILRLSDGTQIRAKMAIGADGRGSALRQMAGISVRQWEYDQSALVFVVRMSRPHDGISTEIHRTGGPLTLVPMPDREGAPHASIVWLSPRRRAAELNAMDDAALSTELTAETMGLHGPLQVAGPRAVWPMMSQVALSLTAPRLALIAEAAHVMPPIGAQGLNTSLSDIEALASVIAGRPDPGDADLLARYQARQLPRIMAKVAGVDVLNRASMTEAQPLRDLRRAGLKLIAQTPLRKLAIRAGLGS